MADVLDVPTPNTTLKVLQTRNADAFYILNLANRTAAPLDTASADIALSISPLGDQVWTYVPDGTTVFATDFAHELPRSLLIERPVSGVYEVAARRPATRRSWCCTTRGASARRYTTRRRSTTRPGASTPACSLGGAP